MLLNNLLKLHHLIPYHLILIYYEYVYCVLTCSSGN